MKQLANPSFTDRQAAAAEAKKAMLARFQPKPTVVAENLVDRATRREQEREEVRVTRQKEREEQKIARAEAIEVERKAQLAAELAALDVKRSERKERKQMMKSDAQAKRAARLAMYARS